MTGFPYAISSSQYLSNEGANTQSKKFLPKNTLLISCIGSAGAYCLVAENSQCNQQINAVKFYEEKYTFYMYCLAKGLKEILEGLGSNGATMTNVNKSKFENIEVIICDDGLLKRFHDKFKNNFEVILNLQYQNQRLKEARDILLPRLMSGMIEV